MLPLRIIVVDDDHNAALAMAAALEAHGHQTRALTDPARVIAEALAFSPQTILLDLNFAALGMFRGAEIAAELRAHPVLGTVRLIAVSGQSDRVDRDITQAAGFDHHLKKPLDIQTLLDLLQDATKTRR